MSDVLVDTSAWVAFLRGESAAVRRVDRLLADGRAAITGPIVAEVLSGARTRPEFDLLKRLLHGVNRLPDPQAVWDRVAEHRFALARLGHQASLVDLAVALAALDAGHAVLTRDLDFRPIRIVIPVDLEVF
jgi:predicted nucleic acid-binding protein